MKNTKESSIDLILWDVYRTLIDDHNDECTDCENNSRQRPGALELINYADSKYITQITISDGDIGNLNKSLYQVGIDPKIFFDKYKMVPGEQKDIENLINYYDYVYKIKFDIKNILVIGDNYHLDIDLARKQGANTIHVPITNPYGINPLPIEEIKNKILG